MHTTKINETTFHHNGDYSGDVIIHRNDNYTYKLEVPFEDLLELVVDFLKSRKIAQLENMDNFEFLDRALGDRL